MIISRRFRQASTTEISVTDYSEAKCNTPEVQEITVSASIEQLQNLANAIGSGNLPGAVIVAADIAAGATVAIVKGTGGVLGGIKKAVCRVFHC